MPRSIWARASGEARAPMFVTRRWIRSHPVAVLLAAGALSTFWGAVLYVAAGVRTQRNLNEAAFDTQTQAPPVLPQSTPLDLSHLKFDDDMVVVVDYDTEKIRGVTGVRHNPATVAACASSFYSIYRASGNAKYLDLFRRQLDWLEREAVQIEGGGVVWHYDFDLVGRGYEIRAPWPSSFSQAAVLPALCDEWERSGEQKYRDLAIKSVIGLATPIEQGGVCWQDGDLIFFEEVPEERPQHILNAMCYALVVVDDVRGRLRSPEVDAIFAQGIESLARMLPRFDMGWYSRYRLPQRSRWKSTFGLSRPYYQRAHVSYMSRLYAITGRDEFRRHHERWRSQCYGWPDRLWCAIYALYTDLLNAVRQGDVELRLAILAVGSAVLFGIAIRWMGRWLWRRGRVVFRCLRGSGA